MKTVQSSSWPRARLLSKRLEANRDINIVVNFSGKGKMFCKLKVSVSPESKMCATNFAKRLIDFRDGKIHFML